MATSGAIVEDGTGVAGADTYASTAFVDSYAAARNNTVWPAYPQSAKDAAVIIATDYLDITYAWVGDRNGITQGLQWPRTNAYDASSQIDLPNNYIPTEIQRVVADLAIKVAAGTTLVQDFDRGDMIKSESVAGISITYMDAAPPGTTYGVARLLKGLTTDAVVLPPQIVLGTPGSPGFYQGMFDIPGAGNTLIDGGRSGASYYGTTGNPALDG